MSEKEFEFQEKIKDTSFLLKMEHKNILKGSVVGIIIDPPFKESGMQCNAMQR